MLDAFCRHFGIQFRDRTLLKLALTHRSYLSVTGQGPRESNERLEFLGDSVLGLVTSEFLYRRHPNEHEGQLTKTKSLLVSKAILSRRALAMGLGKFVLLSHSETESGGRQRLSILADAFESVLGAVYLDQGFEAARAFIDRWLLQETSAITSDKRHTNYKSHLQEYVQSTFRTHPVYRIRSEMGPDHSKHFMVEVMVGKRALGEGKGRNKKEAEQAAARDALERVDPSRARDHSEPEREERPSRRRERERPDYEREERPSRSTREETERPAPRVRDRDDEDSRPMRPREEAPPPARAGVVAATSGAVDMSGAYERGGRRSRRGGRGRRGREERPASPEPVAEVIAVPAPVVENVAPAAAVVPLGEGRFARFAEESLRGDEPDLEVVEVEPMPPAYEEDENEEVGRPEGPLEERHIDVYDVHAESEDMAPREAFAPEPEAERWEPESASVDEAEEETGLEVTPPAPRTDRRPSRREGGNRSRREAAREARRAATAHPVERDSSSPRADEPPPAPRDEAPPVFLEEEEPTRFEAPSVYVREAEPDEFEAEVTESGPQASARPADPPAPAPPQFGRRPGKVRGRR